MGTNSKEQMRLKYKMRIKEQISKTFDLPHEFGSMQPNGGLMVYFPFPAELEDSEVDEFGVYPSGPQEIPEDGFETAAEISQTEKLYEDISEDDYMDVDELKESGHGIRDGRKEVDNSTIQQNGTAQQGQASSSSEESATDQIPVFKRLDTKPSTRSSSPYSDVSSSSENEWQSRPRYKPYASRPYPAKLGKRHSQ